MANIIVVEDDENLNRIICSYLSQNNYRVRGCRNAAEAFARSLFRPELTECPTE